MTAQFNQSGWLIEHTCHHSGTFEMAVARPLPFRGLTHVWRDQHMPFVSPEIWNQGDEISSSAFRGPFHGASCIFSRYGNLEIVVSQMDGLLAHFWCNAIFGWRGPTILPGLAAGPPAFIQSRFGSFGNFEVIVAKPGGGLAHFWRENDNTAAWHEAPPPISTGNWSGLTLIHNRFDNLELAGVADGNLVTMFQIGIGGSWIGPDKMEKGFIGRPALLQRTILPHRSEIVAATFDGKLMSYSRNEETKFFWKQVSEIGKSSVARKFDDVTMFENKSGYLEVVAREVGKEDAGAPVRFKHYRKALGANWEGPLEMLGFGWG